MEVKLNKNGILKVSHKLKKGENYKFFNGKKFSSVSIFQQPTKVRGISSYCEDGKHIIFLDYDNICRWIVLQDFRAIQEKYSLPPAYLFCTKEEKIDGQLVGNYHVMCLSKKFPSEIYNIISETHADVNYISMPLRNNFRNWVLRLSNKKKRGKPEFYQIIGELNNLDCEISKPHLVFLNKAYYLPKLKYANLDENKKIFLQTYETMNV